MSLVEKIFPKIQYYLVEVAPGVVFVKRSSDFSGSLETKLVGAQKPEGLTFL
jgi:hypothetical protein